MSSHSQIEGWGGYTYAHMITKRSHRAHTHSVNLWPLVWALWASPPFLTPTLTQGPLYQDERRGTARMEKEKKLPRSHQKHQFASDCLNIYRHRLASPWCCNWGVLSLKRLPVATLEWKKRDNDAPDGKALFGYSIDVVWTNSIPAWQQMRRKGKIGDRGWGGYV